MFNLNVGSRLFLYFFLQSFLRNWELQTDSYTSWIIIVCILVVLTEELLYPIKYECRIISMISLTGAYTTHQLICRMALTSYDQIPENLAEYCYVEFTMPATQVSHTTARSVSFQNHDSDTPPEKYVRNLSRHEYRYDPPTIINILHVKLSHLLRVSIVFLLEYRTGILILKL